MLVSKTTLTYLNNSNLKEHISWAIENRFILANIDRDFKEDVSGNRIDDITPEEIQAGTKAVKEYCLAINELGLLKQYLHLVLKDDELLTEMKALKLNEINQAYEKAIYTVQKEHIPVTEMLSFETQERESSEYKKNGYTDDSVCPTMKAISTARGMDLKELVDKALLKATLYRQASGTLIGKRQGLQDSIEQVNTLEDLEKIKWE